MTADRNDDLEPTTVSSPWCAGNGRGQTKTTDPMTQSAFARATVSMYAALALVLTMYDTSALAASPGVETLKSVSNAPRAGIGTSARPGGLTLDFRPARDSLDQQRILVMPTPTGFHVDAEGAHGRRSFDVALQDWELNQLLHIVLTPPYDRVLIASVDSSMTGARQGSYNEELWTDRPLDLAPRLLNADLAFAGVVQHVGMHDDSFLDYISPYRRMLELLEGDDDYRALARDFVTPPSSWPQLVLTVEDLSAVSPVRYSADISVRYPLPDGRMVEKDGDFIDDEVEELALRPYRPLLETLQDDAQRARLLQALPEVMLAERYAIAAAALDLFCLPNGSNEPRTECKIWYVATQEAVAPAPPTADYEVSSAIVDAFVELYARWSDVRIEVLSSESDLEYRRLGFIDEAQYIIRSQRGSAPREHVQATLDLLPVRRGRGETRHVAQYYRAVLQARTATNSRELHRALRKLHRAIDELDEHPSIDDERRQYWREQVALDLLSIRPELHATIEDITLPNRPRVAFKPRRPRVRVAEDRYIVDLDERIGDVVLDKLGTCLVRLDDSVSQALADPGARAQDEWAVELARLARCTAIIPVEKQPSLLVYEAIFHYAIGMIAAKDSALREEATDRLRMISSLAQAAGVFDQTMEQEIMALHTALYASLY